MALTPINKRQKVVKKSSGSRGLAGLVAPVGAAVGGAFGAATGGPGGAIQGAAAGAGIASTLGGMAAPPEAPKAEVQGTAPVQLTAIDEASRSDELLAGLRVVQNDPTLAEYASPLTEAFIKSRINLKNMG